ncbi:hypothetical protein GF373_13280, partial [bacterium]|nr:hypothetical protein [bacterium]
FEHFPACDETRKYSSGFTPHCTIAQAESRRQKEEWLRGWRESWNPLAFSVNAISLISREGAVDDMFKVENTIQLG